MQIIKLVQSPQSTPPTVLRSSFSWLSAASVMLVLCLLFAPYRSFAQEFRATISGTVSDATGAVIPGASLLIKQVETGSISRTTSDAAGQYVVPFLQPGNYIITV